MPEQHLDDADIDAALQQMGGEAVPERVHADLLGQSCRLGRGPAGGMEHLHVDRLVAAPRKQPVRRSCKAPVGPQDTKKLRREHEGSVLGTLAMTNLDQHAIAINIRDPQADGFRGAQPRGISGRQGRAGLQRRDRLKETHDLVGAQDRRQLAGRARIGNPFGDLCPVQRNAVEEAQRTNRLVQRRPGNALRYQIDLEGADVLQSQPIRRTVAIPAELRDGMKIGSLRGWRQVAKRHVVDHTAAQRAYRWCGISHGVVSR